jgi:hypothetical protein
VEQQGLHYLSRSAEKLADNGFVHRLELDNVAALRLFIKKIFFKIEETLVVFRVTPFDLFIEENPQSGFFGVSFDNAVTQLTVLRRPDESNSIFGHTVFSRNRNRSGMQSWLI